MHILCLYFQGDEESDSGRGTGSSANSDNGVALNTLNGELLYLLYRLILKQNSEIVKSI